MFSVVVILPVYSSWCTKHLFFVVKLLFPLSKSRPFLSQPLFFLSCSYTSPLLPFHALSFPPQFPETSLNAHGTGPMLSHIHSVHLSNTRIQVVSSVLRHGSRLEPLPSNSVFAAWHQIMSLFSAFTAYFTRQQQ